jgi:pimeloyl-ACP methyl ester carboxylesterase
MIKSGYDQDVEFIPAAKHLVEAGFTVLMYDQRNHGESECSPDGAPHDVIRDAYHDIVAAVKFVSEHTDLAGKDIGLLSFCQSSMVSMVAMTNEPEVLRTAGVKAMVVVQPISLETFYRKFGLPEWVIDRARSIYLDKGATALKDQTPLPYAGNVFVPVLYVQNINDYWSDMDESRAIYDAIPTDKEAIWLDENEKHRFLAYNWFNDNPKPLLAFMDKYLTESE